MSRTSRLLLATAGLLASCGRGQLEPLDGIGGLVDDAGNPIARDASGPRDALPPPGDTGPRDEGPMSRPDVPQVFDSGVPRDATVRDTGPRDGGAPFECQAPADCFITLGAPRCPGGAGRWECIDGLCNPDCPMNACNSDCDCPFELSCTPMGCVPLNRPNFCCANPQCIEGQACVNPDGTVDVCEDRDAGINDRGTRRDTGVGDVGPGDAVPTDVPLRPDTGVGCSNDCDCAPQETCMAGRRCIATGAVNQCCTNPGCAPGAMCINPDGSGGICGPMMPTTPVGAACDQAGGQCGPGGFCIDEQSGFPGGYCSQQCGRNNPCPNGATCRNSGGGGNFCLDECTQNADCRTGYNCIQLGVSMGSRVCWPSAPTSMNPMGAPVGSACAGDEDCVSGTSCLQEQGFPDGYCTTLYCDPVTNPCTGTSDCYAFPGLFSLCLAECPSGGMRSTCRPGYYCLGPSGMEGVCIGN